MTDNHSNLHNHNGICFLEALCLVFVYLKMTGHIEWSWGFVISPLLLHYALLTIPMMFAQYIVKKKGW